MERIFQPVLEQGARVSKNFDWGRIESDLLKNTIEDPEIVRRIILSLHERGISGLSDIVWHLLDLNEGYIERKNSPGTYLSRYQSEEQYFYQGTHSTLISRLVKVLDLKTDDVFMDLGSGYGRVPLFVGLVSPARAIGIEIVEERVCEAERVRRRFGLERVSFIQGNVVGQDLSVGTIFFLFNPFTPSTLRPVVDQLRRVARQKKVTIATWGNGESDNYLLTQWDWLNLQRQESIGDREVLLFEST